MNPAVANHNKSFARSSMLRAITAGDIDKVCLFTAQVFCSHEPMCKALRAEVPDFVQQFRPLLAACCTSGLSFLLEDEQTTDDNSIISISLAIPFEQYNTLQWPGTPTFGPMSAIFEDLAHPLESHPGAVLSFVWATHSSHMNKGYTKRVVESTTQAAVQAGCSCLVADATNIVSQHLLQHFGFQPLIQVNLHQHLPQHRLRCFDALLVAMASEVSGFVARLSQGRKRQSSSSTSARPSVVPYSVSNCLLLSACARPCLVLSAGAVPRLRALQGHQLH
jgi:hypothetical protein